MPDVEATVNFERFRDFPYSATRQAARRSFREVLNASNEDRRSALVHALQKILVKFQLLLSPRSVSELTFHNPEQVVFDDDVIRLSPARAA